MQKIKRFLSLALAGALTQEYDVSEAKAMEDADKFTQKLLQLGCLDAD